MTLHPQPNNRCCHSWKIILLLFMILPAGAGAQEYRADTVIEEINDSYDDDEDGETEYFKKNNEDPEQVGIDIRTVPVEKVSGLKQEDAFWYADAVPSKPKPQKGKTPLGRQTWFQNILWFVIIIGFAAVLVLYLSSSKVGLFRRKDSTIMPEGEDEITDDIFAINYQKEIDKAAGQGNFRLAVRLMYLRLLKVMSERNIIRYTQDKTNFDYLLQLHPTRYYKDFFRITRHYEYSWYGQFNVSEHAYRSIRQDVDKFEREFQ